VFTQEVTVTYRDGHTEQVMTDQADVAAWEMWARQRRLQASSPDRTVMQDTPILFMRVIAWNAINRSASIRYDYDVWEATVAQVEMTDAETVDPTQPGTQDEPSPS
jgi:hypothetical protein